MIVNLNDYPHIYNLVKTWIKDNPDRCSLYWMGILCNVHMCPIIVIYSFFKILNGTNEELETNITNVIKFYDYKKIIDYDIK